MKTIEAKYKIVRDFLVANKVTAFVVLFRGSHLLARTIRFFDESYYNHVGVGFIMSNATTTRVMLIDSNADGVQPRFMSERIKGYEDFSIIRYLHKNEDICHALDEALSRGEQGIKYDFLLLPKIAWYKTGDKLRRLFGLPPRNRIVEVTGKRDICSEFAKVFVKALGEETKRILTPQDFMRYRDPKTSQVITAEVMCQTLHRVYVMLKTDGQMTLTDGYPIEE
ncbi:MAG: hypothetical protein AB1458_12095 [Bacteroidota bacterium]